MDDLRRMGEDSFPPVLVLHHPSMEEPATRLVEVARAKVTEKSLSEVGATMDNTKYCGATISCRWYIGTVSTSQLDRRDSGWGYEHLMGVVEPVVELQCERMRTRALALVVRPWTINNLQGRRLLHVHPEKDAENGNVILDYVNVTILMEK